MNKPVTMPPSTYGLWDVTTEGDCEGRTTTQLGVHQGHFDEVALKFANKAYYGLRLKWVDPTISKGIKPKATEVQVSMDIETGTWDLHGELRSHAFRTFLANRPVMVEDGQNYASVKLIAGDSPAVRARLADELQRDKALAKLSQEDRKVLGLE